MPDKNDPEQKTEITKPIGQESFFSRIGRARARVPKSDEQITGNPNELPKNEHLKKIIGKDDAEHGEGKKAQATKVSCHTLVLAHVTVRIDVNGASHSGHDQEHQNT